MMLVQGSLETDMLFYFLKFYALTIFYAKKYKFFYILDLKKKIGIIYTKFCTRCINTF